MELPKLRKTGSRWPKERLPNTANAKKNTARKTKKCPEKYNYNDNNNGNNDNNTHKSARKTETCPGKSK